MDKRLIQAIFTLLEQLLHRLAQPVRKRRIGADGLGRSLLRLLQDTQVLRKVA